MARLAPREPRDLTGHLAGPSQEGTTDPTTLTYDLALEEALCHGWIDGQVGRRDERTYVTRFTPRRARSQWSARNVGIVYAVMYRVDSAKRPETRARRIEQFVAMLARGETLYPQKRAPDT